MLRVIVEACARLHLGFYNIRGGGRCYGGIGVSIDKPCVRLEAEKAEAVEAGKELLGPLKLLRDHYGLGGVRVRLRETIPRHVGLGSTTQLYLAAARAYLELYGARFDAVEVAALLGRAKVSGVGLYSFTGGGLIIDAGRPENCEGCVASLAARIRVPPRWRFIVVTPKGRRGLTEREEAVILENPRPMPRDRQSRLYEILLTGLLPALAEDRPDVFGRHLTEYQEILGSYYSGHQGGIFATPESEIAAKLLLKAGAYGVGQSSWGPSIYGVSDSARARRVAAETSRLLAEEGVKAEVLVARPRNRGAKVRLVY